MKQIIFICMVAICSHAYSQHYMDNWYFGIYSSIDFSSGSPLFHYSPMRGFEANATISDSLGNLLFFTNGISIWDKNENMMPNGDDLEIGAQVNIPLSIGSSIAQGVIILPKPGNKKQYYIFYLSNGFATGDVYSGKHLEYSIVDMNLNGGNGDILTSQKNIIVNSGDYLWEKLTAVKHGNGEDWWLVGLSGRLVEPDSFYFEKFLITEGGVSDPEFQFYDLWSSDYKAGGSQLGQMKFSLSGQKLANTRGSDVDVFTFDRCTGILGNRLTIDTVQNKSYGIEFSSDESKLYVSTWGGPPNKAALYQVCLDCIPIKKTRLIIYPTGSMGQLQIGPDRKIYTCFNDDAIWLSDIGRYLSVINYPDSFGLACEFFDASFQLGDTAFVILGLPNFVNYDLAALTGADSCATVGVQTIAESTGIKIYPNPANQYIFLSDKNNHAIGCESLLFYNATGVLVKKILHPPSAIDVSNLPQGMYVVQVKYITGETYFVKLEIIHL